MSSGNGEQKIVSVGPWGGPSGGVWDDGVHKTVRQVLIVHGAGIDSIRFQYDNKGTSAWSEKHGGRGGSTTDTVMLDYPEEYLTSIRGHWGGLTVKGPTIVRSITFESNEKTYGPFGTSRGSPFALTMGDGKIVGFHGKGGMFLDAIGVHFMPLDPPKARGLPISPERPNAIVEPPKAPETPRVLRSPALSPRLSHEFSDLNINAKSDPEGNIITYGPWGGDGGNPYNDGTNYTGIRQIFLARNVAIEAIRVQYDLDGQAVWESRHGGPAGLIREKVIFDYPNEILTHIRGTYGSLAHWGPNTIKPLTFYTNKGKYGPYGEERGPTFMTKINEGKIIGFHGRESFFVNSIGVHVKQCRVKPYDFK